ncbi:antibiotic resistance protein VanZ [uncultured Sphaerochaeta sp.]|uniref:VanZ family protein n=1 Tax=uncultured Sphaerochaeta sp. TaxID=886478 RepID=UPI002A0A0F15|nr:antibiotic resistance protein VanZ [uncultured Sphaerochaeta sp.]
MRERIPLQMIVRVTGIILSTLVVTLILVFSFMPKESYPEISWIPFADKGDHMAAYAALGFSLFFAFLQIPGSGKPRKRVAVPHSTLHLSSWSGSAVLVSLVVGTLLGIIVELLQPMFERSREWLDLAADFMGLVVGLAIALLVLKAVGSYFATRPWLYDPNWKDEVDETRKEDQ